MNKYEMLYIISSEISDDDKIKVVDKVNSIITTEGGNILNEEKWGVKQFAYPINHRRDGYYVLVNFEGSNLLPGELNRQIRNMNETYRCMIIKK